MNDTTLALADWLDREPFCTCVETARGTDTLGCEMHATPGDDGGAGTGGEGE